MAPKHCKLIEIIINYGWVVFLLVLPTQMYVMMTTDILPWNFFFDQSGRIWTFEFTTLFREWSFAANQIACNRFIFNWMSKHVIWIAYGASTALYIEVQHSIQTVLTNRLPLLNTQWINNKTRQYEWIDRIEYKNAWMRNTQSMLSLLLLSWCSVCDLHIWTRFTYIYGHQRDSIRSPLWYFFFLRDFVNGPITH